MAKEIVVEKSILIDKPFNQVFDFLKTTKNQEFFSVWNMKDPNKETTSEGIDGTEGFIYSWDSKNNSVGAGSQKIIKIVDGKLIEYELKFERPMKNTGISKFLIESTKTNQSKVVWCLNSATKFPMSLFKRMFQKMLGKDISKSLENLKGVLEN